jgi:hypothetical protein
VLLPSVVVVAGAVAGCMLHGERVGLAMKVQRPKVVVYGWVEVGAAEVPKGRTSMVVGMPALVPKVGKIGVGGMAVVRPSTAPCSGTS